MDHHREAGRFTQRKAWIPLEIFFVSCSLVAEDNTH